MRRLLLRVGIGLVTFGLGVAGAALVASFGSAAVNTVLIVDPVTKAETGVPRFSLIAHGCGDGYVEGYQTDDGQSLDDGVAIDSPENIKRDLRKWISGAKKVIERVPKYRNSRGEVGERIVIFNKPKSSNMEWVSIIFYDGGDSYRFIDAPTLDLALEFEKYLISIDFRSPVYIYTTKTQIF